MKDRGRRLGSKISPIGMTASVFGVVASSGSGVLWLLFLFVNPYSNAEMSAVTYSIAFAMCSLSVLGIIASVKGRIYLMYLVFLGSVPAGLYFLLTPGVFKWFGALCMLYLVSAMLMTLDSIVHGLSQNAKQF